MLTCEFAYFWKEPFLFINLKAGASNFIVYLFVWHHFLLEYPTQTYAKQVSITHCKKVKYNTDNNKTDLLLHHVFLFQDLVDLSCCCWALKLLTIQQLVLQLLDGLQGETTTPHYYHFNNKRGRLT